MKTSENRRVPGPVKGRLEKYIRCYVQGEIIFSKGDSSGEIFYLLEGEVDMYMPGVSGSAASTLGPDSFFGEMGHLLSEDRSATVQAKTGVSALALPPRVFDEILKYDAGLDRVIIEQLSRRLKLRNEQLSALSSSADH
jgi:CRP-like cAMP-binding protein